MIEANGATIIPGWIDMHNHMGGAGRPAYTVPIRNDAYSAALAYGITTVRDPSASTRIFDIADAIESGSRPGPRVFSTGPALTPPRVGGLHSAEEMRAFIEPYARIWHAGTIKQYFSGGRRVRQWIADAAREFDLFVTSEGGGSFTSNLSMLWDGYSGIEHPLGETPLRDDVIQMMVRSGVLWTPTLAITGFRSSSNRHIYESRLGEDEKFRHFHAPDYYLFNGGTTRPISSDDRYLFSIGADVRNFIRAGGHIGIGSHGDVQGIGFHWELWDLARAGVPVMDLLRAGTIWGAEGLGIDGDVGTIEPGRRADLQILGSNPLDDIRNTNSVRLVVRNGIVYNPADLNRLN
jgi:hypothetical protein